MLTKKPSQGHLAFACLFFGVAIANLTSPTKGEEHPSDTTITNTPYSVDLFCVS